MTQDGKKYSYLSYFPTQLPKLFTSSTTLPSKSQEDNTPLEDALEELGISDKLPDHQVHWYKPTPNPSQPHDTLGFSRPEELGYGTRHSQRSNFTAGTSTNAKPIGNQPGPPSGYSSNALSFQDEVKLGTTPLTTSRNEGLNKDDGSDDETMEYGFADVQIDQLRLAWPSGYLAPNHAREGHQAQVHTQDFRADHQHHRTDLSPSSKTVISEPGPIREQQVEVPLRSRRKERQSDELFLDQGIMNQAVIAPSTPRAADSSSNTDFLLPDSNQLIIPSVYQQSPSPPFKPAGPSTAPSSQSATSMEITREDKLKRDNGKISRKTPPSKELWQTIPKERRTPLSRPASHISTLSPQAAQSRDVSPHRPPSTYSDIDGCASDTLCDSCRRAHNDISYCNVCQYAFCPKCWAMQITHRNNQLAPGNVPHEQTSRELATKIKNILEPDLSGSKEEELHTADESTTWFGIIREQGELPIFQDYGRYATLMSDTSPQGNYDLHATRYPGLVSFVGQTGAGKSTLIKMVIDLSTDDSANFATPIVGSVKNQDVPTSGDVHLYPDPNSISSVTPILYADCEGLEGGEREPISSRFKKNKHKFAGVGRVSSFERRSRKTQHTSEREITWADTPAKQSREFAVTHLYPRLLYTFSDVVVFVLKNPRTIESVFEKLVDWAAAALEKSSNQPVLPHAIIVLNASENSTEPELWDADVATRKMLQSLSGTMLKNDKFKKYATFWRERQRQVDTVEQLLQSYYTSIKVIRIPTHGRPNLISGQVASLYRCIQTGCTTARLRKGSLRMLLDADELQPYLQFAFDHFACDLDTPFDFVQASFVNSPIPSDFGGNILKLAISVMDVWKNVASGLIIFRELSYMIASCIMLDSTRHGIKGNAEQIFPQYVEHLDAALENFCDRHWPCEYVKSGQAGGRCVNVRSGHGSKGHQLKSGKVLAVGEYFSEFSFAEHRKIFQYDVYHRLDKLLQRLRERRQANPSKHMPEDQAAIEEHRDMMKNFYAHSMRGHPEAYISHTACFCCLFEPPEHGLPCGHVLCSRCLTSYGVSRRKNVIEIDRCPIDSEYFPCGTWTIGLKPQTAGVRILTLDGGGIRGIVELEILRQIQVKLNGISIKSFFDLVVGTSTGGIIALGLVANDWSVAECTQSFEELCSKAFTARVGTNIPGVSWLVEMHNHSRYETQPLQEALVDAYGHTYLFGGQRDKRQRGSGYETKVAVTSTSTAGNAMVLSNYNRPSQDKLPYHFQRPERLSAELKTWEAARATSAAPRIFKPMCHEPSKQVYADGGIYHNNPIQIADQERKLLWPLLADDHPDIVVSIGTSYNPKSINRVKMQRSSTLHLGILNQLKTLKKIAQDHIASTLDSEQTWTNYLSVLDPPSQQQYRYVRLNPKFDHDPPALDQVGEMYDLKVNTRDLMSKDDKINKVALQLVATSFYFEKTGQLEASTEGGYELRGHIHCRLDPGTKDVERLGNLLRFSAVEWQPYFVIQEEHRSQTAERVHIPFEVVETMISSSIFKMKPFSIKLFNRLSVTEIFLSLSPNDLFHISHFPRSLLQDDNYNTGTRYHIAANSSRWSGRSGSQRYRNRWTPPDVAQYVPQSDVISSYSNPMYVLGNTSTATLQASASRLQRRGVFELEDTEYDGDEGVPSPPPIDPRSPVELENWEIYEMG